MSSGCFQVQKNIGSEKNFGLEEIFHQKDILGPQKSGSAQNLGLEKNLGAITIWAQKSLSQKKICYQKTFSDQTKNWG